MIVRKTVTHSLAADDYGNDKVSKFAIVYKWSWWHRTKVTGGSSVITLLSCCVHLYDDDNELSYIYTDPYQFLML